MEAREWLSGAVSASQQRLLERLVPLIALTSATFGFSSDLIRAPSVVCHFVCRYSECRLPPNLKVRRPTRDFLLILAGNGEEQSFIQM